MFIASIGIIFTAWGGDGLRQFVQNLPGFADNFIGRIRAVLGFTLATLTAFGFDWVFTKRRAAPRTCSTGRAARVNAGAGLVFPVFNYGRLINQVRVQDAQFQQAVLNYQNTVLQAQQEVENGLAAFAGQQRVVTQLADADTAARRSTDLAIIQYKSGQTDYTTVLSAEQAQLTVEDALASARGGVVQGIISVYRALGGGWQIREGHDVVSDEVKAEMARRTDWGRMLEPSHHLLQTPPPENSGTNGGK